MASDKSKRLEQMAQSIQKRWGSKALRTPGSASLSDQVACISTTFVALDHALGIGGIPRGRITTINGAPTSGMSTLSLCVMAAAQLAGDIAIYVDCPRTFDADYAVRCGVNLDRLLVCRPKDHPLGLSIARDLIGSNSVGVLVYDLGMTDLDPSLANSLIGLLPTLAGSPCALIFLSSSMSTGEISQHAALCLAVQKQRWLQRRSDIRGYRTRITIQKNKLAPPGRPVTITIRFDRDMP